MYISDLVFSDASISHDFSSWTLNVEEDCTQSSSAEIILNGDELASMMTADGTLRFDVEFTASYYSTDHITGAINEIHIR